MWMVPTLDSEEDGTDFLVHISQGDNNKSAPNQEI